MIRWDQVWNALVIISPAIVLLVARAAWDLLRPKRDQP